MKLSKRTLQQLKAALREDIGMGDRTSRLMFARNATTIACVFAREKGIFCGEAVARKLANQVSPRLRVRFLVREGKAFQKGKRILEIKGPTISVLELERTLLNFLGHLSGVSTLTHAFVAKTKKHKVAVLDTRKTTPLWRELEKHAVKVGGGQNHRFGLYDEIFVKENHRVGYLVRLAKYPRKFVIEVRDQRELVQALSLKPRVILFDNYTPKALKKAVQFARKRDPKALLEASGGLTLRNAATYARTGIHQISVGSLTHSVPAINFSLLAKSRIKL